MSLFWVSITGLVIYGAFLAAISCLLGGGTIPIVCVLLWDRTSTFAVIVSPTIGLVSGLTSWMVATKLRSGTINITTTSNVWSSLTGDCVSLGMGAVCIVVFSFPVPSKKKLVVVEGTVGGEAIANVSVEKTDHPIDEEGAPEKTAHVVEENAAAQDLEPIQGEEYVAEGALTPESLKSQKRLAWYSLAFGSLIFRILIPFTLYWTGYEFSVKFFTGFVVIVFIWVWASFIICVFMPLWESRKDMWYIVCAMYRDMVREKFHHTE
ncbi:putative urea active transporter [Lachnellula hyalina]|uniref:Putative urea active transporter n=1 Tax=Lachnellula hyalina TaxID=1316788 RepID=A0A8H8R6Y7_9HELO|nr:putative urea active transporter [Lachnellula hyalina]TVY29499.1 putative urea active transporter [Lachnellula hyalina]